MGKIIIYYWISLIIYGFIIISTLTDLLLFEFVIKNDQSRPPLSFVLKYFPFVDAVLTVIFVSILNLFLLKRAPANRPASAYLWRLLLISIISYALCEAVAIEGLGAYIIGGNKTEFYLIWGMALLLLMFYFPRYSQWEKYIRGKTSQENPGTPFASRSQ